MTTEISPLEQILIRGDLSALSIEQRESYVKQLCEALGLNILLRPFDYLVTREKGVEKVALYANKSCSEQLARLHGISLEILDQRIENHLCITTVKGIDKTGRINTDIGVVPVSKADGTWRTEPDGRKKFIPNGKFIPLSPDEMANARMKSVTKGKRRVVLSLGGLGMLDESEIETMRDVTHFPEVTATPIRPALVRDEAYLSKFQDHLLAIEEGSKVNLKDIYREARLFVGEDNAHDLALLKVAKDAKVKELLASEEVSKNETNNAGESSQDEF